MNLSTDSLDNYKTHSNTPFERTGVILNRNATFSKGDASLLNRTRRISDHLNYGTDEEPSSEKLNSTYSGDLNGASLKRNSFGCSAGSADSLDRLSSLSNASSRGSNRMLNMAEVDAIVERQEQSECWCFWGCSNLVWKSVLHDLRCLCFSFRSILKLKTEGETISLAHVLMFEYKWKIVQIENSVIFLTPEKTITIFWQLLND